MAPLLIQMVHTDQKMNYFLEDSFTGTKSSQWKRSHVQLKVTLAVHNLWTALFKFLLADPHATIEGRQRSEDGTTNPRSVSPFGWCNNFDLGGSWGEHRDLLQHALADTREQCRTPRKNYVVEKTNLDFLIAFRYGLKGCVCNAIHLETDETWLEENLRAAEALIANINKLSAWKFEGRLFSIRCHVRLLHCLLVIKSDETDGLLNGANKRLLLEVSFHAVTALGYGLTSTKVHCEITSCEIETNHRVRKCPSLINRHSVSHAVPGIEHTASGAPRGVQGDDCLGNYINSRGVEVFEHYLDHPFAIGLGVL
mmetsp:Transcript_49974/g.150315  ORF Transcript_49974/g.150315 Transcript_49974/m.150315 type:complete len:311 (-) Transcript_49974:513-1445(-)